MKKKALSYLLVLSVAGAVLAGCQAVPASDTGSSAQAAPSVEAGGSGAGSTQANLEEASADEGDVTISFMGWGTDAEIDTYRTLIAQFEERYPNVHVDYITVADNEFDTKLQTMIGAGQCPDVFYCNIDNMMKYAATGNLYNLTDYVADNEIFDPDNVWDCLNLLYRYDGENQGSGDIYALPKDVSAFPIFYNVDLFRAAGIEAPTADNPWDWNDFIEAAQKLTSGDGEDKIYGTGSYSLESAVWSNGAEWVDQETLTEVMITDPAFTEALQFCADLSLKYGVAPSTEESGALSDYDRFKQGKLAMVGAGTWNLNDFQTNCDFEWDVMPWPVSPNTGKTEIWFGSAGLAVSATTQHPLEACNLTAYLAFNEDSQRTAWQMGQAIPMLKDMAYGEYMESDDLPASKDVFFEMMEHTARLATQSRTFNQEWFAEFNSNVASVMKGEMTAEEYCSSISDTVQSLLDECNELKADYAQ